MMHMTTIIDRFHDTTHARAHVMSVSATESQVIYYFAPCRPRLAFFLSVAGLWCGKILFCDDWAHKHTV